MKIGGSNKAPPLERLLVTLRDSEGRLRGVQMMLEHIRELAQRPTFRRWDGVQTDFWDVSEDLD